MSGPRLPFMAWYPRDFAASTSDWPLIARGLYRELLDKQWDLGSLPGDFSALKMLARCTPSEFKRAWVYVEQKFPLSPDGRRRNPRLEQHRAAAIRKYEQHLKGAQKTNAKRWKVIDGGRESER